MFKINRLKIDGFRRLHQLDLKVKPFMVLIGANGVGKTSMLDAFSLLSDSASGKLKSSLSEYGGIASILTRGKAEALSLLINLDVENRYPPLEYELSLAPRGTGFLIAREVLSQNRAGHNQPFKHIDSSADYIHYYEIEQARLVQPNWSFDYSETSLYQVPKMFKQPEELRRVLATVHQYHVLDVSSRAPVKLPQAMKPATLPGADGEDLVPYLYYLREADQNRYEAIIDTLRTAFPGFDTLGFPPIAAGMLTMTWKDKNLSKPFYLSELSEGTLRFLWLISLLHSPDLAAITMIDEPEVSLHPELLSLLADTMREASKRTQLIVATHSDRLIRFLQPEEVVVMDINENGNATATWADAMDLGNWLSEYSLDEIWRMGRMGGRS